MPKLKDSMHIVVAGPPMVTPLLLMLLPFRFSLHYAMQRKPK